MKNVRPEKVPAGGPVVTPPKTDTALRGPTPSDLPPDQQPGLGMDEGETGGDASIYFTKAPRQEAWHAFTADHEPIGLIQQDTGTKRWTIRIGRQVMPSNFGSATAARAYILGWQAHADHQAQSLAPVGLVPGQQLDARNASGIGVAIDTDPGQNPHGKPDGGYDASAATTVTG